ncbi:MAG: adenylate cyclase [Halothiobacillaceae bacterium]|nr:MAG: adenylate cyclase [Halothiobacillaceae bacterium]
MATEIERKFLVKDSAWRTQVSRSERYRQGYLNDAERCSIRLRVADGGAYINIKSATLGIQRTEYEYAIPLVDANEMLERFCLGAVIDKTRHFVTVERHLWEIDVFAGDNAGLVVAEIELAAEDEPFTRPNWVGEEVSHDPRYYNVSLVTHPFKNW